MNLLPVTEVEKAPQLQVHPNPSSHWVSITTELPVEGELQVYNALGQLVHQQRLNSQQQQIQVDQWTAGWYQVQLITQKQGRLQASFIKTND